MRHRKQLDNPHPRRIDEALKALRAREGIRANEAVLAVAFTVIPRLPSTFQVPAARLRPKSGPILVKHLTEAHLTRLAPSPGLSEREFARAEKQASRYLGRTDMMVKHSVGARDVVTLSLLPPGTTIEHVLTTLHHLIKRGQMVIDDTRLVDARVRAANARDKRKVVDGVIARVQFANFHGARRLKELVDAKQVLINGAVPFAQLMGNRGVPRAPFEGNATIRAYARNLIQPPEMLELPTRTALETMKRLDNPVRRSSWNYNREAWEAEEDEAVLRMGVEFRDTGLSHSQDDAVSVDSQIESSLKAYEASSGNSDLDATQRDAEDGPEAPEGSAPEPTVAGSLDLAEASEPRLEDVVADYDRRLEEMASAHKREIADLKKRHTRKADWLAGNWRNALEEINRLQQVETKLARLEQGARTTEWLHKNEQAGAASSD